jgi:hypothetical protein
MAEVLWTPKAVKNDEDFERHMRAHYRKLTALGVDFGFPSVPVNWKVTNETNQLIKVELEKRMPQCEVMIRTDSTEAWQHYSHAVIVDRPTRVQIEVRFNGKTYPDNLSRKFHPHLGTGKKLQLGYEINKYYPAGGAQALCDGQLGGLNFRDGQWQAVAGQNMEVISDLGSEKTIHHLESHWYHYINAWIFRPSQVTYYVSMDGVNWKEWMVVPSTCAETEKVESIQTFSAENEPMQVRYVKMVAQNNGPCPAWHNAAGEPSWLFCDELIIE